MYFYNPENYDPKDVLPESLQRYADDSRYFIHKIYEQRIFNGQRKTDFVPLKAEYLRKIMSRRKYVEIRKALLSSGVIESDGWYVKGKKAMGYKLGKNYHGGHKRIKVTNKRLIENIKEDNKKRRNEITLDTHLHLRDKLEQIEIKFNDALVNLDCDDDKEQTSNIIALEMIRDKYFFFTGDQFGRIHTNLTNLKSTSRKWLRHKSLPIIELDISNSQPFFFSIILILYLYNNKLPSFNHLPLLPPLPCHTLPKDVIAYVDLVQRGVLYEYLAEKFKMSIEQRRIFKTKFFSEIFFGKNGWTSKNSQRFAETFPTVYKVIQQLKKKDYRALSNHLQRVESSFIINSFIRRCMDTRPDMFIATIHDSVLVKPEDARWAKNALLSEFDHIGIVPTIREEEL